MSFDIDTDKINSLDDAIKWTKKLIEFFKYICDIHQYTCYGIIGISEYSTGKNFSNGKITINKFGKKEFTNNDDSAKRRPHLHMQLVSNPSQTVIKLLEEYLAKKGITFQENDIGKRQHKSKKCCQNIENHCEMKICCNNIKNCGGKKYLMNRTNYTILQASKCRYFGFGNLSNLGMQGIIFCKLISDVSAQVNNNKRVFKEIDNYNIPDISTLTDEDIFESINICRFAPTINFIQDNAS